MIEDFRLILVFVNLKIVNECDIFLLVLPESPFRNKHYQSLKMSSFS